MLIHLFRYSNLKKLNKIQLNYLSRKIGIISHYLCDYTCYPHAHRKTYMGNMREHMKYEVDLNKYSSSHEFKRLYLEKFVYTNSDNLVGKVEECINRVVEIYMNEKSSFDNDLNFAYELSYSVASFVIETIYDYREDMEFQFIK